MNKCQKNWGKRTKIKRIAERYTCRRDMSPMVTKHVSLSLLKIQPKMMGSYFMSRFSIIYNSHCVHVCVNANQIYATFFKKIVLNAHISCKYMNFIYCSINQNSDFYYNMTRLLQFLCSCSCVVQTHSFK